MAKQMRVTSRHVVIIISMVLLTSLLGTPAGVWSMISARLERALGGIIMCMCFLGLQESA